MANESTEVQLARLQEQMKIVLEELHSAKDGRKAQYEQMSEISNRLQKVESSLANQAPTIEEFITIKHKVVGAGLMGKWIWLAAGGLITFVYSNREALASWLAKN